MRYDLKPHFFKKLLQIGLVELGTWSISKCFISHVGYDQNYTPRYTPHGIPLDVLEFRPVFEYFSFPNFDPQRLLVLIYFGVIVVPECT